MTLAGTAATARQLAPVAQMTAVRRFKSPFLRNFATATLREVPTTPTSPAVQGSLVPCARTWSGRAPALAVAGVVTRPDRMRRHGQNDLRAENRLRHSARRAAHGGHGAASPAPPSCRPRVNRRHTADRRAGRCGNVRPRAAPPPPSPRRGIPPRAAGRASASLAVDPVGGPRLAGHEGNAALAQHTRRGRHRGGLRGDLARRREVVVRRAVVTDGCRGDDHMTEGELRHQRAGSTAHREAPAATRDRLLEGRGRQGRPTPGWKKASRRPPYAVS